MRVVISGMGVISALGLDQEGFWQSLASGQSGIGPIPENVGPVPEMGMSQVRFKNGAAVLGYDAESYFPRKTLSFMDRFAQFSVIAAREAVTSAGIEWTEELRESSAVISGSCMGGRFTDEIGYWELFHHGRHRVHPLTIPLGMSNAGASHISMEFGLHGPAYTFSTACSSSAHAIGNALWMVRSGAAPLAIAGGSEAPLFLGGLKAWEAMRVVSPDTCRPFSAKRSGMILGEGAAMLVLEPLERALARGVKPLAEIVGFGMSADACHVTQPSAEGAARAIRAALRDGGLVPEQVGYINAHGTATEANDRAGTGQGRVAPHRKFHPARPGVCTGRDSQPRPRCKRRGGSVAILRFWGIERGAGLSRLALTTRQLVCATLPFVIPPVPPVPACRGACRGTGAYPDFLLRGTRQGRVCALP
jgi:nodulation protein E